MVWSPLIEQGSPIPAGSQPRFWSKPPTSWATCRRPLLHPTDEGSIYRHGGRLLALSRTLDPNPSIAPMPMMSRDQSVHDSSSSDSPARSDGRHESAAPLPRKPIPRKGHTKSRRGCFNCKRRRIKCNERHPECNHCIKAGLHCEYPANIIQATQRSPISPHPQEVANLRSTPGMFVSSPQAHRQTRQDLTITVDGGYALVPPFSHHRVPASASGRRQNMDYCNPKFRA